MAEWSQQFTANGAAAVALNFSGAARTQSFSIGIDRGGVLDGAAVKLEVSNLESPTAATDDDWGRYSDGTDEVATAMEVGAIYPVSGLCRHYRVVVSSAGASTDVTVRAFRPV